MRWLQIIFLLLLAAAVLPFCTHGTAPEDPDPGPVPPPGRTPEDFTAAENATAGAVNEFGLTLYREIDSPQNADTNLFISPLSAAFALGMAYNGASGQTQSEMRDVLGFAGMSIEDVNESYYGIMDILTNLDPDVILEIANSIWYHHHFDIDPDFVDLNQRYFNAEMYGIDFTAPWVADTVNHWIDLHTHGMITKMVDPPVDPSVITMIINAIYFKGLWKHPFNPDDTDERLFTRQDGTTLNCDMMYKDTVLPFLDTDLFNATYLPYGNDYFNMMILLPDEGVTVNELTDALTPDNWDTWRSGFAKSAVMLGLPKLSYEYGLDMKDVLIALGMKDAFNPNQADFSEMFPNIDMYISAVNHKAKIRVDEIGTVAAAVTVIVGETSVPPMVYCNRPFMFIIYEKTTGTILFIGKIAEPVWEE